MLNSHHLEWRHGGSARPAVLTQWLLIFMTTVVIFSACGWSFGWPPIEAMLQRSRVFADRDHSTSERVYTALFTVAGACVDLGGLLGTISSNPRTVAVIGGTLLVLSMVVAVFAVHPQYVVTSEWFLFVSFAAQSIGGMMIFSAALNLAVLSSFVMPLFICAFNAGSMVSTWQDSLMQSHDVLLYEIFIAQASFYLFAAFALYWMFPTAPFTKHKFDKELLIDKDEIALTWCESFRIVISSKLFWFMTLLVWIFGVQIKWVLMNINDILVDVAQRFHVEPDMTASGLLFNYMVFWILVAFFVQSGLQKLIGRIVADEVVVYMVVLGITCIFGSFLGITHAWLSLSAQKSTIILLPLLWVMLYTNVLEVIRLCVGHVPVAWGFMISSQGIALFSINLLKAWDLQTVNSGFAVGGLFCVVGCGVTLFLLHRQAEAVFQQLEIPV